MAQRDINLLAATNSLTTTHYSQDSQSGLGVNINHNYGNTKDALSNAGEGEDEVSQASSTLLAIDTLSNTHRTGTRNSH